MPPKTAYTMFVLKCHNEKTVTRSGTICQAAGCDPLCDAEMRNRKDCERDSALGCPGQEGRPPPRPGWKREERRNS